MPSEDTMLARLVSRLGELAYSHALPHVERASRQLARGMSFIQVTDNKGALFIPHYWAIYVHDGRGSFGPGSTAFRTHSNADGSPRKAKFLVWFRNPNNDPRLNAGLQAIRASGVRRLNKEQFKFWLKQNDIARKLGAPLPMIVLGWPNQPGKRVGPTPGAFFFGNAPGQGMHGFYENVARFEGKQIVQEDMRELLGKEFFKQTTETITLRA